jgi:imidazolonepropionase-like amidohydrolase
MQRILIENAQIWDALEDTAYPGTVLIEGNRIKTVAKNAKLDSAGADVIDGAGMTLMPGMVEGHCHPSFTGVSDPAELGLISPEQHMLLTAQNCRLLLEHGFTSIFEAASAKPLLGVTARNAINSGLIAGPRMLAASPEVTVTAGLGDARLRHIYQESFGLVGDGPDELRRIARECVRDGVDVLKINVSGDQFVASAKAEITPLTEGEMAAFMEIAKLHGVKVAAHARSSQSVKMSVRHGVDCIYHCDFADTEALDMLEAAKDRVFVGPAFGLVHNNVKDGERFGVTPDVLETFDLQRKFDMCCATYHEVRKRGIRNVIGGDYGFAATPMGMNARDISHFVEYFGYSPAEALRCATTVGQELMGMADDLGTVREGKLADLLLVRGNPLADVSILQDRANLAMIMKDGVLYKDPRTGPAAAMAHLVAAQ